MIWADFESLCRWRYRVMPVNPAQRTYARKLRNEMGPDCRLSPSPRRPDFYELDAPGGWYYVHVHHASRTVYVIAHFPDARKDRKGRQAVNVTGHSSFAQIGA